MTDEYGTRVSLASGNHFFVAADMDDVVGVLSAGGLVRVGGRYVNPSLVAQLEPVRADLIPSHEILERLDG